MNSHAGNTSLKKNELKNGFKRERTGAGTLPDPRPLRKRQKGHSKVEQKAFKNESKMEARMKDRRLVALFSQSKTEAFP